ncbi:MAG: Transglycosylase-associated protein [Candidatus Saccharibacteria bacterium]|nr:Transglycosylase-associated protein [Candidatus Saccharibacteria bacterium]
MSIIITLIVGGLVGYIAARLLGRREGVLGSVLIGIVGSFIGSFISTLFSGSDQAYLDFSWVGIFWSLIGALVLVGIMNAMSHPSPRHHV